jgi:hypothetical protein
MHPGNAENLILVINESFHKHFRFCEIDLKYTVGKKKSALNRLGTVFDLISCFGTVFVLFRFTLI